MCHLQEPLLQSCLGSVRRKGEERAKDEGGESEEDKGEKERKRERRRAREGDTDNLGYRPTQLPNKIHPRIELYHHKSRESHGKT